MWPAFVVTMKEFEVYENVLFPWGVKQRYTQAYLACINTTFKDNNHCVNIYFMPWPETLCQQNSMTLNLMT